jgi:hypothetical protein
VRDWDAVKQCRISIVANAQYHCFQLKDDPERGIELKWTKEDYLHLQPQSTSIRLSPKHEKFQLEYR